MKEYKKYIYGYAYGVCLKNISSVTYEYFCFTCAPDISYR